MLLDVQTLTDNSIYCDYCKYIFQRKDKSFSFNVRVAVVRVVSRGRKGVRGARHYCLKCVKEITHFDATYSQPAYDWPLLEQLKWAESQDQGVLDV